VSTQYDTQVKTYGSTKDYQRDAPKMAQKGWESTSQVWQKRRPGCFVMMITGGLGYFFFSKDELTVTYRRAVG
jgi:hypothetical protein